MFSVSLENFLDCFGRELMSVASISVCDEDVVSIVDEKYFFGVDSLLFGTPDAILR